MKVFTMIVPWRRITSTKMLLLSLISIYSAMEAESLIIDAQYFVWRSIPIRPSRLVEVRSITENIHDNVPIDSDVPFNNNKAVRRKKKNKYENFSRVNDESDPLETLIEESKRMNQHIITELVSAKQKPNVDLFDGLPSIPSKVFPDVKNIDPYDPETFGYLLIGTIIGAHGVHGWLKVQCTTDFPIDRLCTAGIRHLKSANKRAPREVVLLNGKHRLGDEYLIQLDQINDRDAAQTLRGSMLYIREEQKTYDLNVNEYVVSDLVGSDVYLKVDQDTTISDMFVGIVGGVVFSDDMCSVPGLGHDYLEIILPRGVGGTLSYRDEMVLIPMVPEIVPEVDIAGRRIMIDPPAGLLDLTYIREEKTRIKGFLPPAKNA